MAIPTHISQKRREYGIDAMDVGSMFTSIVQLQPQIQIHLYWSQPIDLPAMMAEDSNGLSLAMMNTTPLDDEKRQLFSLRLRFSSLSALSVSQISLSYSNSISLTWMKKSWAQNDAEARKHNKTLFS